MHQKACPLEHPRAMIRLSPTFLPSFSPSPQGPRSCPFVILSHPIPPSRKVSLSSMALPKDLLVIFTSIANNEEAAGEQAQTSSLLPNMRVPGCLGLPVPWERPEMQRSFLPLLSGCRTMRVLGPGAASSVSRHKHCGEGWAGKAGGHSWPGTAGPVPLPSPGPALFLPLLVPHWAGPG